VTYAIKKNNILLTGVYSSKRGFHHAMPRRWGSKIKNPLYRSNMWKPRLRAWYRASILR